jgi:hypothetical protein
MNDDELITIVREQRDKVPMTAPLEQVISRGRAVRARRRIPGMAGALAAAATAALAVTALVPSGHHPAAHAQLTAWTVTRQAGGKIDITISELRNPAGLQARLRADGLPATVSFSGPPLNPACKPFSPTRAQLRKVGQFHPHSGTDHLVLNPSALPDGTGVAISIVRDLPPSAHRPGPAVAAGLVYASPQCTGS